MENLVWRTPGADGGRDIEGETYHADISGSFIGQKWYVECKHYSTSLDWPTVRNKVAYAESNDADVALIATTSNPSPKCESEISKWNALKKTPLIRFWRGYDLPNIVRGVPHIGAMFGLGVSEALSIASLIPLAESLSKVSQAAYSNAHFESHNADTIEVAATISELFAVRLRDLRDFGKPVPSPRVSTKPLFPWLSVEGSLTSWIESDVRAALSFLRYEFQAKKMQVVVGEDRLECTLVGRRDELGRGLIRDEQVISFWSRIKFVETDDRDRWYMEQLPYG